MSSVIDVCNEALSLLQDEPITALTDANNRARLCNRFYASVRDHVLGSSNWRHCSKRAALAQLAETPAWEYTYYYQIPADCVKIIRTDLDDDNYEWKREGDKIATDETGVNLLYVERVEDPMKWSTHLKEAIVIALAEKICTGLGKGDRKDKLREEYEYSLSIAQFYDSVEGTPEKTENTELTEIR